MGRFYLGSAVFSLLRRRLADDAHEAWRWGSMRFLALGGVVQAALLTTPDAVKDHVPEWVLQGMASFSLFCVVAAGVSRITITADGERHDSDPKPDHH